MIDEILKVKSIVEILVLAALFFVILNFIKGTRGAAILKGIIFIFVIAFVGIMSLSDAFGLVHVKQLLQWLLSVFFIAVIIIFAPEIRKGLSRIAQTPAFLHFVTGQHEKTVKEVVQAVLNMSKRRIGAIITLQQNTALSDLVESSVKVDAEVTGELIESIFYPGSPLHDGGIIIGNNKILAAACIFPLTDNPDISKTLGTRHRAAIGTTEDTDAVSVVVSEETGKVSICMKGEIRQDVDEKTLYDNLMDLYKVPPGLHVKSITKRLFARGEKLPTSKS